MASDNLETILGVKLILPSAAQESSGATAQTNRESDEEYDTIPVLELEGRMIKLGRLGENNTQTVKIDCSEWLTALPGCQLMIAALRPGESEIYLPGVSVVSGVITWPILAQDTALAGVGRAEVRAVLGSKVKKSVLFRTRIEPALDGDAGGTPTTPPDWVQDIMGSVEASQAAAAHAEALIEEATACAINAVRFDEDQGLTDEQKATGRGNIDAASVAALQAQAEATTEALAGKVALDQGVAQAGKAMIVGLDGNVTTGDAVQIDATLQGAGQAADAAAVGAALAARDEVIAGKVAVDQGIEQAGMALVVGDNGEVTTGEAGISDAVKKALMTCFEFVAWKNELGQTYFNDLRAALFGFPRLRIVFEPGTTQLYVSQDINAIVPFLTVYYQESAETEEILVPSSEYTISGVLNKEVNDITITYNNCTGKVKVPVDAYHYIKDINLTLTYGHYDNEYDMPTIHRHFRGMRMNNKDGETISGYDVDASGASTFVNYIRPLNIPLGAQKVTANLSGQNVSLYKVAYIGFSGDKVTKVLDTEYGDVTRKVVIPDDARYLFVNITKSNGANFTETDLRTTGNITFE